MACFEMQGVSRRVESEVQEIKEAAVENVKVSRERDGSGRYRLQYDRKLVRPMCVFKLHRERGSEQPTR
jgi:hypothetical protein